MQKQKNPHFLWDYDEEELNKTEAGRIKILERMINYGPGKGRRIKLELVEKYWDRLDLYDSQKRLFEFLLWNKIHSSPQNSGQFSLK